MMASKYAATKETTNFARFSRIYVELLRDVLWAIVKKEFPLSADIVRKIEAYILQYPSRQPFHRELARVSNLGRDLENKDCDISLLYSIIRNICSLNPPARGWNSKPLPNDETVADDVERIHLGRHAFQGHSTMASLSDVQFRICVQDTKVILCRLDMYLNANFSKDLDVIVTDEMDQETVEIYQQLEENGGIVQQLQETLLTHEEDIKKLSETVGQLNSFVKSPENKRKYFHFPNHGGEEYDVYATAKAHVVVAKTSGASSMVSRKAEHLVEAYPESEVEDLENRPHQTKDVTSATVHAKYDVQDQDWKSLQEYLRSKYRKEASTVRPLSNWNAVKVLDIVTPLKMKERQNHRRGMDMVERHSFRQGGDTSDKPHSYKTIQTYRDIFVVDGASQQEIVLLGEAGMGKSTFCLQLLNLWCMVHGRNDTEAMLNYFDFVFFIQLRISKKAQTGFDMLLEQCCPKKYHHTVDAIFRTSPERCLVVMDGLDEWNEGSDHMLPNTTTIDGSVVLTTSRPWRIETLERELNSSCRILEIQGLDKEGIQAISLNMFKAVKQGDPKGMVDKFTEQINSQRMQDLIRAPMMLILMIRLWLDGNESLSLSTCWNYTSLINSLIGHSDWKKNVVQKQQTMIEYTLPTCFSGMDTFKKYMSTIERLAEFAFNVLFCNNSLVFTTGDLEEALGKDVLKSSLQLGILSESTVLSQALQRCISISFCHKTVQEYLAAFHLSGRAFIGAFQILQKAIQTPRDMLEYEQILVFLSGLAPDKCRSVCQFLAEIIDDSPTFNLYRCQAHMDLVSYAIETTVGNVKNLFEHMQSEAVSSHEESCKLSSSPTPKPLICIPDTIIEEDTESALHELVLESVYKHRQSIKSLHFSNILRFVETPSPILQCVGTMTNLVKLGINISSTTTTNSLKNLCETVSRLQHLVSFSLCFKGEITTECNILTYLQESKSLQSLHLQNINLSMHPKSIFPIKLLSLSLQNASLPDETYFPEGCTQLTCYDMCLSEKVIRRFPISLHLLSIVEVQLSQKAVNALLIMVFKMTELQTFSLSPYPSCVSFDLLLSLRPRVKSINLRRIHFEKYGMQCTFSGPCNIFMGQIYMDTSIWLDFLRQLKKAKFPVSVVLDSVKGIDYIQMADFLSTDFNVSKFDFDSNNGSGNISFCTKP